MSTKRRPSLPPLPDLSHLTEEERKIIESVIQRQKEEEEKEQEILRLVFIYVSLYLYSLRLTIHFYSFRLLTFDRHMKMNYFQFILRHENESSCHFICIPCSVALMNFVILSDQNYLIISNLEKNLFIVLCTIERDYQSSVMNSLISMLK